MTDFLRWFSGGRQQYCTLIHCMNHDSLWIAITVALDLMVALGYVMIAAHWWRHEQAVHNSPAQKALGRLKKIFIFCGLCGYVFIPIKMIWPAWRLYDMAMGILVYLTWQYALRARDLKVIYGTLDQTERLAHDLHEARADRDVLRADIVERKQIENALRDGEQRYRFLADAMPQIVWTARPDGHMDYFSARWKEYTALSDEESRGSGWRQIVHPEDLSACGYCWENAVRTGEPYETEHRLRRASDGAYRWHLVRALPRYDESGNLVQWVGTYTDINDQKQAELALKKMHNELELRVMQRTSELATSNRSLKDEIAERRRAESALKGLNETLERRVAERSAAAEVRTSELLKSEEALRDQARILQESETRFRQLAECIDEVFWIYDPRDGQTIYISRAYEAVWGRPGKSRDGKFAAFLETVHEDDRARVTAALDRQTRGTNTNEEYRIFRPDGGIRWIRDRGFPITGADGQVYRVVGLAEDVTERRHAEDEVRKAKESAEAASRAKSEFLANMSHEIRTPMTAIVGFADLMLQPNQDQCGRAECVQVIRRNARHFLELINEILDLSKIEAGRMTVERIPCDVTKMLADIVSSMRPRAIEKGLGFTVTFDGPIPRQIQTDPLRLRQILVNLVGNAIKFTDHGRIAMRVRAEGTGVANVLRVDVVDSGVGMTPEQVGRLFFPFTQADESTTRKFGGTGLGLTISRRLARLLGGDIGVKSEAGVGSTFTLWVDGGSCAGVELLGDLTEDNLPEPTDPSAADDILVRGRILLAEDGRDNQRLLSTLLRMAGAEVVIAENGQVACDLTEKQPFDLILMDMQMPVMDGYTATAELRRRGLKLPIVALTAHAMAEDRAKSLASGCTEYLTKPVERETLLRTVAQQLGQAQPGTFEKAPAPPPKPQPACDPDGPIKSSMAHYPRMKEIIVEFVDGLPPEVAKITDALRRQDLDRLKRVVHQLRGSGGGYGFDAITELAAQAEDSIKAADKLEAITAKVQCLIETIRRIEGFDKGKETLEEAGKSA